MRSPKQTRVDRSGRSVSKKKRVATKARVIFGDIRSSHTDPPMADQHFAKKTRTESSNNLNQIPSPGNWVGFIPIDSVDPVICNLQTLEYARPALYIQAVRDDPACHTPDGIPAHRTGFTRAQLAAFVSSFYVQRLMVTKNVLLDELVGMFTQQGVAFTWKGGLPDEKLTVPSGVAVSRLTNNASASVREACDVLARGLCYWKRLELCMDASLGSQLRPLPESIQLEYFAGFDCTATRAWIRFNKKPKEASMIYSTKTCQYLVSEWPFWLDKLIRYLGCVYVEHKLSGKTETTFLNMTEAAQNSPLHSLWWLAKDGPCPCGKEGTTATVQLEIADGFASFIRASLHCSSFTMAAPHQPTLPGFQTRHRKDKENDGGKFSRACVAFCLKTINEATDYSALFSGSCADDNGETAERTAFAKALEPMGVRVVKWSDDLEKPRKAIAFPPYAGEIFLSKDCPAVLLEFPNR